MVFKLKLASNKNDSAKDVAKKNSPIEEAERRRERITSSSRPLSL
jgi:hypothetical protein